MSTATVFDVTAIENVVEDGKVVDKKVLIWHEHRIGDSAEIVGRQVDRFLTKGMNDDKANDFISRRKVYIVPFQG